MCSREGFEGSSTEEGIELPVDNLVAVFGVAFDGGREVWDAEEGEELVGEGGEDLVLALF